MGQSDRWHTPKQIKIERAGEPRGTRRGPLKKGERRKGVKARRDELLASMRVLKTYAEYILRDRQTRKEHPEWYRHPNHYDMHREKYFDAQQKKHTILLDAAVKDGIITLTPEWLIEKP